MAETITNGETRQEFWRSPHDLHPQEPLEAPESRRDAPRRVKLCISCSTEFVVGARYCYVCGRVREPKVDAGNRWGWPKAIAFGRVREALHLSGASLVALIAGIACLGAAVAVGFIYSAQTLVDWQAIQWWRSQWLLAAVAAFCGGLLLRGRDA